MAGFNGNENPLRGILFPADENEMKRTRSTVAPQPTAKSIHPLEGKAWFRLVKLSIPGSWIVGLGIAVLIGLGGNDVWLPLEPSRCCGNWSNPREEGVLLRKNPWAAELKLKSPVEVLSILRTFKMILPR